MINKNTKLALLGVILFGLSISSFNLSEIIVINENTHDNIIITPLTSTGFWNLTGNPIYIDDLTTGVGAHNWTWAENQPWCSGSGSWIDPYVIENVTIDGQGSGNCIEIKNSYAYFIIQNCSLYNAGHSFDNNAGIELDNIDNGKIMNNNFSNNYYFGIDLKLSNNNTLSGNTANNNKYGIRLYSSDNNTLLGNTANNNNDGIRLSGGSDNITLSGNVVTNNDDSGIIISSSDNNTLSGNTVNNNLYGIYISSSDNNTLSGNIANNNNEYGILLFLSNNNTLSGNLMSFCGITLYGSLTGISSQSIDNTNLVDNKPVYYYANEIGLESSNFTNAGQIILINCNNSIISGFNLSNGTTGIYLGYSNNNTLLGNTLNNNENGIDISSSYDNTLSGNIASNNTYGIEISSSNNNTLSGNTANNNDYGIRLSGSDNNTLSGNLMKFCGIILTGSLVEMASHNIDNTNLVNNKSVYYYVNELGLGSSNFTDAGQIILINCNNSIITGFNLSNSTTGIYLYDSNNNTLSGNTASNNNLYGIYLEQSNNNTLSGNTASYNDDYGIRLYDSNNNTLSGNTASNNNDAGTALRYVGIGLANSNNNTLLGNVVNNNYCGISLGQSDNNTLSGNTANNNFYGIRLYYSFNNTFSGNIIRDNNYGTFIDGNIDSTPNLFFKNSFIDNSIHAYDNGRNTYWDNGTVGNYWDDYNGEDSNNDGIGNIPYDISGPANSQDNYPIWWDPISFIIGFPVSNMVYTSIAPTFIILINEGLVHTSWYTIDSGLTNITFTGFNGTINQSEWDKISSGFVTLTFYANNTLGDISSSYVVIGKDVSVPIITINNPQNSDVFGATSPSFDISIDEPNLDTIWYSLNGGTNRTFTGLTGTINQALWDALPEGNVVIKFYANDTLGRIGFQEVTVVKEITQPFPPGIPGYDLLFLGGIISVMVVIIIKKRVNHLN